MAAFSRSPPLLLLLFSSVFLCGSVLGLEPVGGPPEPPDLTVLWTPDPPADDAPSPAADGSKLSEVCREDLTLLCPGLTWTDHLAALECLQDRRELSQDCKVEVQRILHQRALDVTLDPELQNECMTDLGKWCPEATEPGQKDFRFSYKFKMACKEDVLRLCPNITKKVDAVVCLSTTVRNDTLQEAREQRVSLKCRKQLRVEELARSEDIQLEPELYDPCKSDISRLCPNVAFGNAQVIECLKDQKKQLSQRCHQRIFRLQQVEMSDPELDYQLMRVCKQMIKRFCTETSSRYVFECLKQNKYSELMDPKCKQMIIKRQITQNTDYRLNPVLRKACRADIPKFCQSVLNKASENSELEGQVIACLKLKYADQNLSPDCEDQIRVILRDSALDYRLDPQLQMHCSDEIFKLCPEEAAAQEQTGQVLECLKNNLLEIKQEGCIMEVVNMLKQGKADVFVDPVLHTACALDIKHHCASIPPGRGRQMSCVMEALQDGNISLQPGCQKRLQDRIDMWSYAATLTGVEPLCCPTDQFWTHEDRVPSETTRSTVRWIIFIAQSTFDWFPRLLPYI